MDHRRFKRLLSEVLDHDPTQDDMRPFFTRVKVILESRELSLQGITTDASPLYPKPSAEVCGDVPPQRCDFHVIAELTTAVLRAVAKVRKAIRAQMPAGSRGRPRAGEAARRARVKKRLETKIGDLCEHRDLFGQQRLTRAETRQLRRISRGQKGLRTRREIMDEGYRLFDRRCRTHTALEKLAKWRARVRRFKGVGTTLQKLFSPSLEKALTCLDETWLPSPANAVERGNRRHRTMQKTGYRGRALNILKGRMALDMRRDSQAEGRLQTLTVLHADRAQCR